MSNTQVETNEAPPEEPQPNSQVEEQEPQEGDGSNTEEGDKSGAGAEESNDADKDLPDWARTKMSAANSEAAKYRTALREAEARLATAKTVEEFESATAELRTQNAELERQILVRDIASEAGLPKELADVLKGTTPEELKAHAKVLSKFANVDSGPEHLSGGLDPNDSEGAFDPVAAARKAKTRRY